MCQNKKQLENLLRMMDVPARRRTITKKNVLWLARNLGFKNGDSVNYGRVMKLIKEVYLSHFASVKDKPDESRQIILI